MTILSLILLLKHIYNVFRCRRRNLCNIHSASNNRFYFPGHLCFSCIMNAGLNLMWYKNILLSVVCSWDCGCILEASKPTGKMGSMKHSHRKKDDILYCWLALMVQSVPGRMFWELVLNVENMRLPALFWSHYRLTLPAFLISQKRKNW
jgi:hypothetical protein